MAFCSLFALALLGCAAPRATILATPTKMPASSQPPPLSFRLDHPVGKQIIARPRPPFTVSVSLCDAKQHPPQEYAEALPLPQTFVLGDGQDAARFAAEAAVMAAAVRGFYGFDRAESQLIEAEIALDAPPGTRATFTLRWDEIWDQNGLQVLSEGAVIATLPLTVLTSARLVSESVSLAACSAPVGEAASPRIDDTSSWGETEATMLVQDYIRRLNERNLQGAYGLLAAEYQKLVSFDRYVEGYQPVSQIDVITMTCEATADGPSVVHAKLVLALERQGAIVSSPWEATYWLDRRPGGMGEVWRIVQIEMLPTVP
jgi:hypothetical protein